MHNWEPRNGVFLGEDLWVKGSYDSYPCSSSPRSISSSVIDLVCAAIYFSPHSGASRSHQSFLELPVSGSASATLVVKVFLLLLHESYSFRATDGQVSIRRAPLQENTSTHEGH
jgi:hypothetical protein